MPEDKLTEEQLKAAQERADATDHILKHGAPKKVVIAGPGTGKTHLFKQIFAQKAGQKLLTLTFINALVEDLALDLCGISEVRTLHGFALGIFRGKAKIYPVLPQIIQEDGEHLLGRKIDFTAKIHDVEESDGALSFYSTRRKYYDRFGYADIVLALVKYFDEKPERIPEYAQIVVDEYQDFNKLEVSLIEQLSKKNPILIAGDDDQAIYDFKRSSPDFIRALHSNERPDFESFPLPFCSRSTRVIVEAINDVIASATEKGFLKGRVDKPYRYFPCPPKDREGAENPKILHKRLQDAQIPWFIQKELEQVAERTRKKFDVLVISPFPSQCERIGSALQAKGFSAVHFKDRDSRSHPYLDALRALTDDRNGNLAWRLVAKVMLNESDFVEFIRKTEDCSKDCKSLLPSQVQRTALDDLKTFNAISDKKGSSAKDVEALLKRIGCDQESTNHDYLQFRIGEPAGEISCDPSVRKMPITVTTVQSSKGLAADYVFIAQFDERYIGKDGKITNQSICNFLVALTRARKQVWLLSTSDNASPFLRWIAAEKIESL
jgi:ATP-dependent DNA helicase UvrD/PcrA